MHSSQNNSITQFGFLVSVAKESSLASNLLHCGRDPRSKQEKIQRQNAQLRLLKLLQLMQQVYSSALIVFFWLNE